MILNTDKASFEVTGVDFEYGTLATPLLFFKVRNVDDNGRGAMLVSGVLSDIETGSMTLARQTIPASQKWDGEVKDNYEHSGVCGCMGCEEARGESK